MLGQKPSTAPGCVARSWLRRRCRCTTSSVTPSVARWTCRTHRPTPSSCRMRSGSTSRLRRRPWPPSLGRSVECPTRPRSCGSSLAGSVLHGHWPSSAWPRPTSRASPSWLWPIPGRSPATASRPCCALPGPATHRSVELTPQPQSRLNSEVPVVAPKQTRTADVPPTHAPRESATPVDDDRPADAVTDVIVVGGGGGGLPTALYSRWLGNEVMLLEKAPGLGGTAKKAAFWYWVPNNVPMRALGLVDDEPDFLRYVARLARPTSYDPASPTLGLSQWEYDMCRAIYESASPAAELLAEKGALEYRHCPDVVDYWSELPEDKAPTGRVLVPQGARDTMSDGGAVGTASMAAAAERDGIDIRVSHRVQRLVVSDGAVVGVEATTPDGRTHRIAARKAVIFATGGFTHDLDLRRNFLHAPVYGGCAALNHQGDFLAIAGPVGAQPRNMIYAWMCPVPLERAVARDPGLSGMFSVAGDSTIFVDRTGRRVVNEKLQYNELAQKFFTYYVENGEYPYLVLVQIWDQRSQDHSASDEYGRQIVPPGTDDSHVIRANTLEELADAT